METVRDSIVRSIACLNFVVFTIHWSLNEYEPRQTGYSSSNMELPSDPGYSML